MSAQIIYPAKFHTVTQQPSTDDEYPRRRPRSRGLVLTEEAAHVLGRINRGEVVTDIGQISRGTRRLLDRLTKRGQLLKGRDFAFPKVKNCWRGAAPVDENDEPRDKYSCYDFR